MGPGITLDFAWIRNSQDNHSFFCSQNIMDEIVYSRATDGILKSIKSSLNSDIPALLTEILADVIIALMELAETQLINLAGKEHLSGTEKKTIVTLHLKRFLEEVANGQFSPIQCDIDVPLALKIAGHLIDKIIDATKGHLGINQKKKRGLF